MLGTEICSKLVEEGKQVRALVRDSADPAKRDKLRSLGADGALEIFPAQAQNLTSVRPLGWVRRFANASSNRPFLLCVAIIGSLGEFSMFQQTSIQVLDHRTVCSSIVSITRQCLMER
jgi:hypothetical protein